MLNYQYHNSAFSVYIVYQFINNKYIWLILPIKWTTVHTFMCLARGVQIIYFIFYTFPFSISLFILRVCIYVLFLLEFFPFSDTSLFNAIYWVVTTTFM